MNPFKGLTLGQSLALLRERYRDREALVFQGRRWTFEEACAEIDRAAARLGTLGLSAGDKVAIWVPNRPEYIWYWLAAGRIGLVAVLLNTRLKGEEAAYQLAQSESRAVIVPGANPFRDFLGELVAIRAGLPLLQHILALDPIDPPIHGVDGWSEPAPARLPVPADATDPDAAVMIVYSSGTTALPKGAMLSHCLFRKAWDHGPRFDQTPEDRLYLCVPLFGILASINGVLTYWSRGSAVVLSDRFSPREALATLQDQRCTAVHLLPLMVEQMLDHPERSRFDLGRLRTGIVVSTHPAVLHRTVKELGINGLITSYGLTEASSAVLRTRHDDPLETRVTTFGGPLPDIEVRIADPETGAPLADGDPGEIQVRGYCLMKGYYNKPEETRAVLTADGWLKTGDIGVRLPDGNVRFHRRLKDGYKYNGFNVSEVEVESALMEHPAVASAAVLGIPDATHGEIGVAFVRLRKDRETETTPQAIVDFLKPRLASFKQPRHVLVVDEMPLTAGTGKVQKFKLRELAEVALARQPGGMP